LPCQLKVLPGFLPSWCCLKKKVPSIVDTCTPKTGICYLELLPLSHGSTQNTNNCNLPSTKVSHCIWNSDSPPHHAIPPLARTQLLLE
ncbi:hypothetical protein A2U01_0059715, partial [Trifolium medium]|nr:hypothetical protein [Trifolium medium]